LADDVKAAGAACSDRPLEAELLDPRNQRGRLDAEQLGGAAGTVDFPTCPRERGEDIVPLALAQFRSSKTCPSSAFNFSGKAGIGAPAKCPVTGRSKCDRPLCARITARSGWAEGSLVHRIHSQLIHALPRSLHSALRCFDDLGRGLMQ
jgi:hypothetical protein